MSELQKFYHDNYRYRDNFVVHYQHYRFFQYRSLSEKHYLTLHGLLETNRVFPMQQ